MADLPSSLSRRQALFLSGTIVPEKLKLSSSMADLRPRLVVEKMVLFVGTQPQQFAAPPTQ